MHAMRGFGQNSAAKECAQSMSVSQSSRDCIECDESGLGSGFVVELVENPAGANRVDALLKEGEDGNPTVPLMTSGAGHDALAMAPVAPIAMLFVRCRAGISHSPEEYVAPDDVMVATRVLFEYLMREMIITWAPVELEQTMSILLAGISVTFSSNNQRVYTRTRKVPSSVEDAEVRDVLDLIEPVVELMQALSLACLQHFCQAVFH
jgi:hypothetical protein